MRQRKNARRAGRIPPRLAFGWGLYRLAWELFAPKQLEQLLEGVERFAGLGDAADFIDQLLGGEKFADGEIDRVAALAGLVSLAAHLLTGFEVVDSGGRDSDALFGEGGDDLGNFGVLVGFEVGADRLGFCTVFEFLRTCHVRSLKQE